MSEHYDITNLYLGYLIAPNRGGSRIQKRGAQLHFSEQGNCVQSTQSGMESMPNLGGLGHALPENFEKLNPLRLNLRSFLMVCCFYYVFQDSTLQIINVIVQNPGSLLMYACR